MPSNQNYTMYRGEIPNEENILNGDVMDFRPTFEREIVDVSVRKSWNNKLVVQIRRRLVLRRPGMPGSVPDVIYEDCGKGPWRDADANNITEVVELCTLLSNLNVVKE